MCTSVPLRNTSGAFWNEMGRGGGGWQGELKGKTKKLLQHQFSVSNVNNLCSLCFLLLLFIYLRFSFSAACPFFQRHHGQGSRIKLLSLVWKGFLLVYLYTSPSVHLSCYLVKPRHEALMRSKSPTCVSFLMTAWNLNKWL